MIINFFGAPGSGKSTLALGVAHYLRKMGREANYVGETAKPFALIGDGITNPEQLEICYKQWERESSFYGLGEFILTDSPLELQGFYHWLRTESLAYKELVVGLRKCVFEDTKNFWLERSFPFNEVGRFQNQEQSDRLSDRMYLYLDYLQMVRVETHDPEKFIERYLKA